MFQMERGPRSIFGRPHLIFFIFSLTRKIRTIKISDLQVLSCVCIVPRPKTKKEKRLLPFQLTLKTCFLFLLSFFLGKFLQVTLLTRKERLYCYIEIKVLRLHVSQSGTRLGIVSTGGRYPLISQTYVTKYTSLRTVL